MTTTLLCLLALLPAAAYAAPSFDELAATPARALLEAAPAAVAPRAEPRPAEPRSSLTKESFEAAVKRMNEAVRPVVKAKYGKAFLATGDWPKARTPTSAGGSFYHPDQPGVSYDDSWGVHVAGWLAREPGMTDDSLFFVYCHELGHHLHGGGAEVEADYSAPACLAWIWGDGDLVERMLAAYRPAAAMRGRIWRQAGFSARKVEEMLRCRERVIVEGARGLPMTRCQE